MQLLYRTVPFDLSAIDAAQDLLELTAAEGRTCYLVGLHLGKSGGTAERLKLTYKRFANDSTSGSAPVTGGGSITPTKDDDAADGFTAEAGNETRCSSGTPSAVTRMHDVFDPSVGYDLVPPTGPESLSFRDGERLVVGLEAAPASGQQVMTGYATVAVAV